MTKKNRHVDDHPHVASLLPSEGARVFPRGGPAGAAMTMRRAFLIAFIVILALMPKLPVPEFWITQATYNGLYALVAIGLVLLTGVAGLTSFGQAAFVGLGAYTAAYLTTAQGVSPWLTVWVGLGVTFVGALILGWITLRMSGPYPPLAPIAWGLRLF